MMGPAIHILNGPNLDLLGIREPHIYGYTTLDQIADMCHAVAKGPIVFEQTNAEGDMIDMIQKADSVAGGIIINPAAWSFKSYGIADALAMFSGPVIELHLSNIHARDAAHRHSIMSERVTAVIAGLGANGYPVALSAMYNFLA